MTIQVTLIGGPADLQRHVLSRTDAHGSILRIPELPAMPVTPSPWDDVPRSVGCRVHSYYIARVSEHAYVGLHESIAR